jgi:hypothetical protein
MPRIHGWLHTDGIQTFSACLRWDRGSGVLANLAYFPRQSPPAAGLESWRWHGSVDFTTAMNHEPSEQPSFFIKVPIKHRSRSGFAVYAVLYSWTLQCEHLSPRIQQVSFPLVPLSPPLTLVQCDRVFGRDNRALSTFRARPRRTMPFRGSFDCFVGFCLVCHFHKRKPPRPPAVAVQDDMYLGYLS